MKEVSRTPFLRTRHGGLTCFISAAACMPASPRGMWSLPPFSGWSGLSTELDRMGGMLPEGRLGGSQSAKMWVMHRGVCRSLRVCVCVCAHACVKLHSQSALASCGHIHSRVCVLPSPGRAVRLALRAWGCVLPCGACRRSVFSKLQLIPGPGEEVVSPGSWAVMWVLDARAAWHPRPALSVAQVPLACLNRNHTYVT